jgi:hypothetical protein
MKTKNNNMYTVEFMGATEKEFLDVDDDIEDGGEVSVTGTVIGNFITATICELREPIDSETDYVSDSEEEDTDSYSSDSEMETPPAPQSRQLKLTEEISITPNEILFHGNSFPFTTFRTKSGRISITTDVGRFRFDDMGYGIVSISVPKTSYEPAYRNGYTVMTRTSFDKLLNILY